MKLDVQAVKLSQPMQHIIMVDGCPGLCLVATETR